MCDRARFFWENPHWAKMTKNGQKWPQNIVFGLFKKIMSLDFSGICVKWKFLKVSQVIAKNDYRPMRFQYSLIINISVID